MVEAVAVTLGPRGRNVVLESNMVHHKSLMMALQLLKRLN